MSGEDADLYYRRLMAPFRDPLAWWTTAAFLLAGASLASAWQFLGVAEGPFDWPKIVHSWNYPGVRVSVAAFLCGLVYLTILTWARAGSQTSVRRNRHPLLTLIACVVLLTGAIVVALASGDDPSRPAQPPDPPVSPEGPTIKEPQGPKVTDPEAVDAPPAQPPSGTRLETHEGGSSNPTPPAVVQQPPVPPETRPSSPHEPLAAMVGETYWVVVASTENGQFAAERVLRSAGSVRSIAEIEALGAARLSIAPDSDDVVRCRPGLSPVTVSCEPVTSVTAGTISRVVTVDRNNRIMARLSDPAFNR